MEKSSNEISDESECKLGIFIFRKDLRIIDNRGLIKLSENVDSIIPIFIFDPYQVELNSKTSNYLSLPALRFICESVISLNEDLKKVKSKLNVFYDDPINVLKYLKNKYENFCIGYNEDYTRYSLERDSKIDNFCKKNNIEVIKNNDDYTLYDLDLLLKDPIKKECYKQYGAFRNNMMSYKSKFNKVNNKKIKFKSVNLSKTISKNEINKIWSPLLEENPDYEPLEIGGRKYALGTLKNLKEFKQYNIKRDILDYETTHLSAYLNFGCISEREFYEKLVKTIPSSQLINQIVWRDYYLSLLKYLPYANSYEEHIDDRYNKLKWLDNFTKSKKYKTKREKQSWEEWKIMMDSKTGFLIVDAAIKELKKTGFMHNRC